MKIKEMIISSLNKAYEIKIPEGKKSNPYRSSKFVSELAANFEIPKSGYHKNRKEINKEGERVKGEWLLDTFITKLKKIEELNGLKEMKESGHWKKWKDIEFQIAGSWAIESEFKSSYKELAKDFSKLLCVKSDNYLYVNGFNQRTKSGRTNFINTRLELVNLILNETEPYYNLFFAFCPSPYKIHEKDVKGKSFWDLYEEYKNDPKNKKKYLEMEEEETLNELIEVYQFTYDKAKKLYSYLSIDEIPEKKGEPFDPKNYFGIISHLNINIENELQMMRNEWTRNF
jgi:hypothetical protein